MSLAPHHSRNTHRSFLIVPQPPRVERALSVLLNVIKTQADNQTGSLLAHTLKPGNSPLGSAGSHIPPHPYRTLLVVFFLCFLKKHLFIWLCQVLVVAGGTLSCGRWDLVPGPGREPRPPALGAQSLGHWTSREVPPSCGLNVLLDFLASSPRLESSHFWITQFPV